MMRKILLLVCFCFSAAMSMAQPVLTQSAVGAVGSTFYIGIQDSFDTGFSIGSAGANQNWDFASLIVNDLDTISFLAPAGTPNATDFPTANLVIYQSSLDGYAYLLSSASGLDLLGVAADVLGSGTPTVLHQNPASRIAAFPFTYGNTYNGTTIIDVREDASSLGVPFVDSARYKNIQVRDILADGYGTLALPAASFSNALRVKEITAQTDSIWVHTPFGWSLYRDSTYTDSTFTWWNTTKGYYLAQASYVGGNLNTIRYEDPVIVKIDDPSTRICAAYPIPAQDRLSFDTDGKPYSLEVTDLQGRVLMRTRLLGTHTEVPVGNLPRGYFLYSLQDQRGVQKQSGKLLLNR